MKHILVLVTTGSYDEASAIATKLVEQRLAACCSIIPLIHSIFIWEGKLQKENEVLTLIKSTDTMFDKIVTTVKANHSYTLPEIISVNIDDGSTNYLKWISESVMIE